MRSHLADDPEAARYMGVGHVPRDWRLKRVLVTIDVVDALPFLDVEDSATREALSNQLANALSALGYEQGLDISDVRGRDRRLSRAIAHWAYTAQDEEGEYRFSSRRRRSIAGDNPNLLTVAEQCGLHVF